MGGVLSDTGRHGMTRRVVRGAQASLAAVQRLLSSFFGGRNAGTSRAYQADLESLASFVGSDTVEAAVGKLMDCGHGELNALVLEYRAHLSGQGLAAATINRRLAAVRSLLRRARLLGLTPWTLEVANLKTQPYRDTRGPGREGFERLLVALGEAEDAPTRRDRAALRLLFDLALRREEVVSLDLEHLDLERATIAVLGKGRVQRSRLTLPPVTAAALAAWVEARGNERGPLFINFDRAGKGRRLTGRSLYRIVRELGRRAGLRVTPHGLRHAAITSALDLTKGDVRAVQRFSRHRDVRVINVYDDSREDLAGVVARLVAVGSG